MVRGTSSVQNDLFLLKGWLSKRLPRLAAKESSSPWRSMVQSIGNSGALSFYIKCLLRKANPELDLRYFSKFNANDFVLNDAYQTGIKGPLPEV
jgi:hypothetical protein